MDRASATTGGGKGAERLEALSDGVFAIAMTLLVLDVSVPTGLDEAEFHEALRETLPNLGAYALSFAVIAEFWTDHRRILRAFPTVDGRVTGLTLLGLGLIALLPFPTALLAEYGDESLVVAIYSGSVAMTNAVHLALLLTSHSLLTPATERITVNARRLDAADLGATVVVFGIAVPLAFASPELAKLFWITLIPAKLAVGHQQRRISRS
ncbi:TMEM175 family protein [Streptomyces sp. NPDC004647]|uniref:TMEM175 family protein n=1 Tax=Streptomyces sp. NPDC004647 TaxID=3154671 RepID=UPI0033A66AD7